MKPAYANQSKERNTFLFGDEHNSRFFLMGYQTFVTSFMNGPLIFKSFCFQINSRGTWEDLLSCFEIDESTLNAALGLKQVYLRHLEPYEKIHFQVN